MDGQNTKYSREESVIQAESVAWFKNNYCLKHHYPRYEIFSVPNEATWKNNNFKALGVRNGVSDTVVVLKDRVLFIEFKDLIGKQSKDQIDFENLVTNLNHRYYVVKSVEQFKQLILNHIQCSQ